MDEQLETIIRQAFQTEDLWKHVDQEQSHFLNVGHPYTHLVLDDASVYERALEIMRDVKLIEAPGIEYVIRSKWEILAVEYRGPYYDAAGNLYTSSDIAVTLKSGSRTHKIRVAMSHMANRALQEISGTPERDYDRQKQDMMDASRKFVEILLSGKGRDDSWDPLWQKGDLEISADGISWIRSHASS